MKFNLKCILITIVILAFNCIYCNAQNYVENKDSLAAKRKLKLGISVEFLGMRSLVFQKEPYPYQPITPSTGFIRTGYISRPTYSAQFGLFKSFKIYKSFYIKGGVQYKLFNYKYEKVASWTPIIPGINNPDFKERKYYFLSFTNYLMYSYKSNIFLIGMEFFTMSTKKNNIDFPPNINLHFAYLCRYERCLKFLNSYNKINLLIEIESSNKNWNYYQTKIGLNLNFK
jgi:hypothetical protein